MNIVELAKQAGWGQGESYDDCIQCSPFDLEKFAKLIAAHEREECAKVFEAITHDNTVPSIYFSLADTAKIIRARGKA